LFVAPENAMTLESQSLKTLHEALERLDRGFDALPDARPAPLDAAGRDVLLEVAERLRDNYPYFHPLYAGQMLKPPHPVARAAHALAAWINPNNHALDGGRASSRMEKEAVAAIARMFGWETHLGHLSSGGTMANLEALWVAGKLKPGMRVAASKQAHYTHQRISAVLGFEFVAIECDAQGRMDLADLERCLAAGDVGTVVATLGTTATGSVDPLPGILELRERYGFRLHADAAYGGYFRLVDSLRPQTAAAFARMADVDSIVIDPHKHGLQPYGCGCVLFRDPGVGHLYKHDSPYTYFSSSELHLGEISLECSRPGASAVALWATQRLLPLVRGGEFARMLATGREAALSLHAKIESDARFVPAFVPELDIVVWAVRAESVAAASQRARAVFEESARRGLHLAVAELPASFFDLARAGMKADRATITCLRSVLMKPEHAEWIGRIWQLLDQSTDAVLATRAAHAG
jgi:tyrosine decarboxylase/aspartate 1-decarboxylase